MDFLDGRRGRAEAAEVVSAAGAGLRGSDVIDRIETERTAHYARILAARFLVNEVLDARKEPGQPALGPGAGPEEVSRLEIGSADWQAAVDRLPAAAELARRVLEVQPNAWQASMLLGAAVYLERSIRRDRLLYTAPRDWEEPLERAMAEAPGQAEPRRFLAGAYLEVWPALSPDKQQTARRLLTEAFRDDPHAFATLLPVWLEAASGLDAALSVIPASSNAWQAVERAFAERRDWDAFCRAHERLTAALLEEHEERLEEAVRRLELGELFHSRSLLLQVVAQSPLDARFAPLVSRALDRYPAGLHGLASTDHLRRWLRWALELHVAGREVLPPRVISRLASAAGGLEAPERALAAILAGEIRHAESFEQSADSLTKEAWGGYLIAKMRWYVERGQLGQAAAALDLVDRATRRTLAYALARRELAAADSDLVELAEADRELDAFRRREWSAAEWRWRGRRATLPMLAAADADGLVVALNRVAAAGAVIEIQWDGRAVALRPVTADGDLELDFELGAGLHLLEVRMVAGEQLFPGSVRLR